MLASVVLSVTKSKLITSCSGSSTPDDGLQALDLKEKTINKSKVFVKNQQSGDIFYLGFSIETRDSMEVGLRRHYICDIEATRTEYKLREDSVLWKLNGIKLAGTEHECAVAQFKAIDYREFTMSIVHAEDETVMEVQLTMEDASLLTDVNEDRLGNVYSHNVHQAALNVDIIRDINVQDLKWITTFLPQFESETCTPNIRVTNPKEVTMCHIEHLESQMYLQVENGRLVMKPISTLSNISSMIRSMFCGYRNCNGPAAVSVFTFRENVPHGKSYISATSQQSVGIQKYDKVIQENITSLPASDPRLFVHVELTGTSTSVFRSTAFSDHYLSYCGSEVCLKEVLPSEIQNDGDIHFRIRYAS